MRFNAHFLVVAFVVTSSPFSASAESFVADGTVFIFSDQSILSDPYSANPLGYDETLVLGGNEFATSPDNPIYRALGDAPIAYDAETFEDSGYNGSSPLITDTIDGIFHDSFEYGAAPVIEEIPAIQTY